MHPFVRSALVLCLLASTIGCSGKDPPGALGGLVLFIRTFPATTDLAIQDIESIEVRTSHIEVVYSETPAGGGGGKPDRRG